MIFFKQRQPALNLYVKRPMETTYLYPYLTRVLILAEKENILYLLFLMFFTTGANESIYLHFKSISMLKMFS